MHKVSRNKLVSNVAELAAQPHILQYKGSAASCPLAVGYKIDVFHSAQAIVAFD
jgi:hypothetical protein